MIQTTTSRENATLVPTKKVMPAAQSQVGAPNSVGATLYGGGGIPTNPNPVVHRRGSSQGGGASSFVFG
mgnify:FL=1